MEDSIDPSQILFEVPDNCHVHDGELHRPLAKSVIVVFTKDGLPRLESTLPALVDQPVPIVVLDDSTTEETAQWISNSVKSPGVFYHGALEQNRVLALPEVASLREFLRRLGQRPWRLGYCRNYAIVLAKACGFERLLMMDDDIVVNGLGQVMQTLALLEEFGIAGANTARMPDDSVVGHIERAIGRESVSFVSGQYLGLDLSDIRYSFPNIYNEDWIFGLLHAERTRVARFSSVQQLTYDPFAQAVEKALFQEPGEIGCDGVIRAVFDHNLRALTSEDYWPVICEERRDDLKDLKAQVEELPKGDLLRETLRTLLAYHDTVDPQSFRDFFSAYESGQSRWRDGLARLSRLELSLRDLITE